jgi:alanine racemase
MSRTTTATIHLDALAHNLARVREAAPGARVMAVVKADAYGHGLERVALALSAADAFGVSTFEEAERLRAAGLDHRIVLLSGFDDPADFARMRRQRLDAVVHHASQLAMLEQHGAGMPMRVWLKLDTGMHRLGFPAAQAGDAHARLRALACVDADIGLMTHFASSDEFDGAQTRAQLQAFAEATAALAGDRSLANSAAILGWPQAHAQWVRAGGALYGMSVASGKCGADFGLRPAMTLSSRLIAVNRVARGEPVGYSATWHCPEDMPVGVAAIGYGDGYPRGAKAGTPVLVRGVRVPVIGRVSMDLMTLDLRGLPDAAVGDPVVLWGAGLPVEEVAASAGTISYELTCSITRRVRFLESGQASTTAPT